MPTYTQPLLDHITTAALDWWLNKGTAFQNAIQEKPLLAMFEGKAKSFPGGKGDIVISVKGDMATPLLRGPPTSSSVASSTIRSSNWVPRFP